MRVREVRLEHFKSYEGVVRVGPLRNFTCIVGPNGAGKSNLVDAICFVLAVETRALRSERLQGLIHRKDGEAVVTRTAVVELVLEDEARGEEVAFRRIVQSGVDGSRFFINGTVSSQAEYLARLERLGILPRARNFLVLQGDVQKAARQEGRELTKLFEEVSGSWDLRQRYEELAVLKSSREDVARHKYAERRTVAHEKQRVKAQKKEAIRYEKLEAQRSQLLLEFYLYQLLCCRHQIERRQEQLAKQQESRCSAEAQVESILQQNREAEQACATLHLEVSGAERRAREVARSAESTNSAEQVARQISVLQHRLEELRASRDNRQTRRRELEAQVKGREEQLRSCKRDLEQLAAEGDAPTVVLSAAERQEFDRLRDEAAKQTGGTLAQIRDLQAQLSATEREHEGAVQDGQELEAKRRHLRRRVDDLNKSLAKSEALLKSQEQQLQERQRQLDTLDAGAGARRERRGEALTARESMLGDIEDINAALRQLERDQRLKTVVEELQRTVPGVHGRIVDLSSAADERFKVAVNVALGGHADGVVSGTTDQAKQCIQHLKAKMLDAFTFLPLDNLRVHPLDRRVADVVKGNARLRMAIDCVNFQPHFARAFEFLLGDVVIADSLDEARRFCFDELRPKGLACRVVTLQGEIISREGNMAIAAGAAQLGSTCFDFAALGQKKARLDQLDATLLQLDAEDTTAASDRAALLQDIQQLSALEATARQSAQRDKAELAVRTSDLAAAEQELVAAQSRIAMCKAEDGRLSEQLRILEEETHRVSKQVFAAFSAKKGVDDIAAVQREDRRRFDERRAVRRKLDQQKGMLEAELKMLMETLSERGLQDPEEAIRESECELQELRNRDAGVEAEQLKAKLEAQEAEVKRLKDQEREAEREATRLAGELRKARQRLAEASSQAQAAAADLRLARDSRLGVLRQAVLEDVDLPSFSRQFRQDLRHLAAAVAAASQTLADDEDDPAAELCDSLDWSRLPRERQQLADLPEGQGLFEEFRSGLAQMSQELERLRPNLKAAEELEDVAGRVVEATEDVARAQRSKQEADEEFERVRQERVRLFMACFTVVREHIGLIYKRLTSNVGRGLDGGSAYLDLEDDHDPFSAGIKFTVMPPGKRLSDISWLSGGEKTLAAMALLFALQAYRKPPFLVLDEIDAHLDQRNLQALATYMVESSCQTIVVSLKDKFFCHSDALVGVTRNLRLAASVVFTADLQQFRGEAGESPAEDEDDDDDAGGGRPKSKLPRLVSPSMLAPALVTACAR